MKEQIYEMIGSIVVGRIKNGEADRLPLLAEKIEQCLIEYGYTQEAYDQIYKSII